MSEPPSRIPPRNQPNESKAARDELTSKNKVEKVREVDADETRKRKFKSFLDDDKPVEKEADKPSLFDLSSQSPPPKAPVRTPSPGVSSIDGLAASPPPTRQQSQSRPADPLPRSDGFWEDVDFPPDERPPEKKFKETDLTASKREGSEVGKRAPFEGQVGKAHKGAAHGKEKKKKEEEGKVTPFDLAGKPVTHPKAEETIAARDKLAKDKHGLGFDSGAKSVPPRVADKDKFRFAEGAPIKSKGKKEELDEDEITLPSFHVEKKKEVKAIKADPKIVEIANGSHLPTSIQPAAIAATQQASPYLHPSTVNLFFQMVGQIYVMTNSGVSRTEILLNNPSFAGSKFFGSTITIEKYATAPDSFNIRLTGSEQAVASFKENAASLMSAFHNGNFAFKVNRLDAEYTLEKPVFRRKERGEGKGDTEGGLGERRK